MLPPDLRVGRANAVFGNRPDVATWAIVVR